jgi:pSer/pThr/pTyr-binding forkhead associated (FHA) protein
MDWSIFLFVMKWIFLGLVYLVLFLLLIGVQREMRLRLPQASSSNAAVSFGRLRVIQPGGDPRLRPGVIIALKPETNIGSQSGNDLVLRDRFVSGQHARLRWDGASWWVDDLNSTNGTFVNHQRLVTGVPAGLASGSLLEIGDLAFEMIE